MNKKGIILFDIDHTIFDTPLFKTSSLTNYSLYDGVDKLLNSLKEKYEFGILSQGENNLQRDKLKKTGILKFFHDENIHIVENKIESLKEILEKYNNLEIYFIDDRIENLVEAKKHLPKIETVWVKSGPWAEKTDPSEGSKADFVIDNIFKLSSII